jgi:hypothetical protein
MQLDLLVEATKVPVRGKVIAGHRGEIRPSSGKRLAAVVLLSLILSSVANHALAHWLRLSRSAPWIRANAVYRRIGPQSGPQVFCAGSSLLVSGLSWPEVAEALGRGIENWTVAGSSPEVWEVFQQQTRISDTTIIGVSVYDLNEKRLTPERARFVPLSRTVADLWTSGTDPDLRRRILTQYAMSYLRVLYPAAGDADKVLVGLRSKAADVLGERANLQQYEGVVVEKQGILEVEDATMNLGDWSSGRVLRRLEALRAENHGAHIFCNGPKSRAFRRLLWKATQQGRVIVVVLPVPKYYADAFLDKASLEAFEKALREDMASAPQATLVRLDQVPGISENSYFLDTAHLNSSGRRMVTQVFLKEVNEGASKAKPEPSLAMHDDRQRETEATATGLNTNQKNR